MDEPEAALSPRGCLAALRRIHDLTDAESQFVIATHSPLLLALPGATIIQVDPDGTLVDVSYDEVEAVQVTRNFLAAPDRSLHYLLSDE